jgi:hypothetical protein
VSPRKKKGLSVVEEPPDDPCDTCGESISQNREDFLLGEMPAPWLASRIVKLEQALDNLLAAHYEEITPDTDPAWDAHFTKEEAAFDAAYRLLFPDDDEETQATQPEGTA